MGFGDRYSEYEKPAAYAPLLVQRALVLGACSQEAEGRAGKARSPDSVIRMADVMHAQLVVGDTGFHTAVQASAFRSKVASIRPPFWCNAH